MNGSIRVESIEGQGTTFIITFQTHCTVKREMSDENAADDNNESPKEGLYSEKNDRFEELKVLREPRDNDELAIVPRMPSRKVSSIDRPTILVVNDNFVILDVLSYRLEPFFTVTVADCGMAAIEIIKGQPLNYFDVIMMDINMPMMDGFETINKIKAILKAKHSS